MHDLTIQSTLQMLNTWDFQRNLDKTNYAVVQVDNAIFRLTLQIISAAGFGFDSSCIDDIPSGHKISFGEAIHTVSLSTLPKVLLPKFAFRCN